ncbi:N-acetylmuramoyl-L-alanine amidase [Streptomyces sp. NBC_00102]|uniref:N-acetylmuramoyl-L-alanine amidase n=1 Tax=Streptomyces sp. NBC_00102 TaxID=2975652 RepID=UPI00225B6ED1|nr:N-acetylmuramoyl-L-alanine amidase [Streptomyces sp. NBC_00102]MCX5396701.1 N-acetylmuramoyl-L-alanine amidase [Streptomyces sp. NBC_00102]
MPYNSVPPTLPAASAPTTARPAVRRAVRAAGPATLAVLCLSVLTGCGGTEVKAQPRAGAPATGTSSGAPLPSGAARSDSPSGAGKNVPKGPLAGRTVVIDPGHNPHNHEHTREIARQVNIGTGHKECDTTGTSTNAGYAEARFTLDVAHRMRELLEAQGAKVLLTYDDDRAYGPCVDERARIGNTAKADAVVSVHADGSAVGNRGFHVILPALVRDGAADTSKIVDPSRDLGTRIAGRFVAATGSAPSNYIGGGTGLDVRDDLGGLNMSTVPKVFIECGNMRDPKDAALLTSASWRQRAAAGISDGIAVYLKG